MGQFNMPSVGVGRFVREIKELIEDGDVKQPVLGLGKTGIGKTEAIMGICEDMGIGFKEIRLVNHGETDMVGVPIQVDTSTGLQSGPGSKKEDIVTMFARNGLLPDEKRDGPVGILCLDEITSCGDNMRVIAYQLMDASRGVGDYKLPDGWLVVALGNGPEDGGVFRNLQATLPSRCRYSFDVQPNVDDWKKWAVKHDTHPSILAFLSFAPDMLHSFNPDEEIEVICCPRAWTSFSKTLTKKEARLRKEHGENALLSDEDISLYAATAVGEKAARKFMAFYKYNKQTINPEDILSGKISGKMSTRLETEVTHIVAQSLVAQLAKESELENVVALHSCDKVPKFAQRLANALNWALELGESKMLDVTYMIANEISKSVPGATEMIVDEDFEKYCPHIMEFLEKNGNVTVMD